MNRRINITDDSREEQVHVGHHPQSPLVLTREHVQRRLAGVVRRLARQFDCSREYNPEQDALLRARAIYEDLLE